MKDLERRFINPQQGALDTVLPDAVAYKTAERDVWITNVDTANTITVRSLAGQTVNGGLTVSLAPGASALVMSDGANWWMLKSGL